jgi:hypothetical protein
VRAAPLVLLALVAGCGSSPDLFPLEVGSHLSYTVTTGFPTYTEKLQVVRSLSVAGRRGYELQGPLGTSRVAWADERLVAERLVNTEFNPPITLLRTGEATDVKPWVGMVRLIGSAPLRASATQQQAPETLAIGAKKVSTVRSTVTVSIPGKTIEVLTWYQSGRGPVRQIQRTNGAQIVSATILNP